MTASQTARDKIAELNRWLDDGTAQRIRAEADVSRRDVSIRLGVAEATVVRWETGTRKPRGPSAVAYHRLLRRLAAREAAA